MPRSKSIILVLLVILGFCGSAFAEQTIFVDVDAPGANTGSSWEDAYNKLYDALDVAQDGDEIWVAQGTYRPDTEGLADPREATFAMKNGVIVKGGYAGFGEPDSDARDIDAYETILSGDLNGDDVPVANPADLLTEPTRAENCYHVVTSTDTDATAVLDGLTITAGMAGSEGEGGGLYCVAWASPTISRCTFRANTAGWGGGAFFGSSSSTLIDCRFVGNAAHKHAGGLDVGSNMTRVANCTFSGNWAGWNGGAVFNFSTSPVYVNCIFSGNAAGEYGGAMWNVDSGGYRLINCTFIGNTAGQLGGAVYSNEWPIMNNCIFWDNRDSTGMGESTHVVAEGYSELDFYYCCIQGWTGNWGGTGNIGADPLFVDAAGGDFHLQETSPCINAGDNNALFLPATDFEGDPRIMYGKVDMGADEVAGNIQLLLNVTIQPFERAGTVTFDPAGGVYPFGTEVTISVETTEEGYTFDHWSGDLTGNNIQTTITMDSHKYVNAHFTINSDIIYVNANATGLNNGTSWANAITDLQDALTAAISGQDIWVAAGTYRPTSDYGLGIGERGKHFRMKNGVGIYGGFPATGDPDWDDRDPEMYETILSGDLLGNDDPYTPAENLLDDPNRSDNCYHVFYHPEGTDLDPNAVLDGFTITNGNANRINDNGGGMYNHESNPSITHCNFINNSANLGGGGMYNNNSSPTVTHCTFSWNSGGGMYNSSSSPNVKNCTFTQNKTIAFGGGISNGGGSLTVTNCIFSGNSAFSGGGMAIEYGNSTIVNNCTFIQNSADIGSGGILCHEICDLNLINCTFSGNQAIVQGNAIGCLSMFNANTIRMHNCILWDGGDEIWNGDDSTITINYSDIQDGWFGPGTGNIDENPLFVDADGADDIVGTEDDNLRLTPCSPCLDAGDNAALPAGVEDDLDGNSRIVNGIVDMGAYEYHGTIIYVDDDAPLDPGPGDINVSDPLEAGSEQHPVDAIQEAIDCARNGHTVIVLAGNYSEAFNFIGKSITVTSGEEEPAILEAPGNYVATFHSGEDPNSVLKNFILRNSSIGVFCNHASPTLQYLTVVENASGVEAWNASQPQISNSIFWDNLNSDLLQCQAVYSCIERESSGLGNLSADPLFADPTNLDYHLKSEGWRWREAVSHGSHWTWDGVTSPCIDAGNPGSPLGAEPLSLPEDPNNEWGLNLRANMGAYGGTAQASMATPGWCLQSDTDNDGRVNMKELIMLRDQWLIWEIAEPYCDFNRDGIVNLGDFQVLAKEWLQEALRIQ